jgi:hypothetical protein
MAGTTHSMPNLLRCHALALPATTADNQTFNQRAGRHRESVAVPARDLFESTRVRKKPNKQSNLPDCRQVGTSGLIVKKFRLPCPPACEQVGSAADRQAMEGAMPRVLEGSR